MKRVLVYIKMASAVLLLVALQGCGGRVSDALSLSKSNLETRIAATTELLLDKMSDSYGKVQELSFESEYDGAVARILSSADVEYEPTPLISDTLKLRIQLINLYKQAVHEYALLVDDSYKSKAGLFGNCCNSILDTYNELDTSIARTFNKQVMPLVRASRYDKNSVSEQLINALASVWAKDVEALNNQLGDSFQDYQAALASIPDDAFDEEKLAKHVSAPYNGKHNLAEVYKVELIKQRRNMLHTLVKQQTNVSTALQYLQQALAEFVKKSGDNDVVFSYLKRIDLLLGAEDNNSEGRE